MGPPVRWRMSPDRQGSNSLDRQDHGDLARWAADCAEHVLPYFEREHPGDGRPRNAVDAARAWTRGDATVAEARAVAFAAHAAARDAEGTAAREAARAAGHAAATAHVAGHAEAAANYAIRAVAAAPDDATTGDTTTDDELAWQRKRLPAHLRTSVIAE